MQFKDIIGGAEFKAQIAQNIDNGRVPHAQIFEGKYGYQSLSYAVAYAQYLNCENTSDGDSCGKCNSCLKSGKLEHPDIHFIYPVGVPLGKKGKKEDYTSSVFVSDWRSIFLESKPMGVFSENQWYQKSGIGGEKGNSQGSIGRSEADEIFNIANYPANDNGFKIFIIWLPERMNRATGNSLLKLFEEPSDNTVFLFVSENVSQVLPTIVSRTQNITIPALKTDDIFEYMKSILNSDIEVIKTIANVANGDIASAVAMSVNAKTKDDKLELFKTLTRACYSANIDSILSWVDQFATLNKEDQKRFFQKSVEILRASFMLSIGKTDIAYIFGEEKDFIENFHKVINSKNIEIVLEEFESAFRDLSQNGNSKIVVTHFALSLISSLRTK